jgi:hypothetical protein
MLQRKQVVNLVKAVAVKALKGRTHILLGNAGDEFRVVAEHETMPGYYYMRGKNPECPPMSLLHFTEVA